MSASEGDLLSGLQNALFDAARGASERVWLCSPFVGPRTAADLADVAKASQATWRLLTWLRPAAAAHGSLSIEGLEKLMKAGVEIGDLRRLHAKLFLFDGGAGYAGSANLTLSGLGGIDPCNYELSLALTAPQRAAASSTFESWWSLAAPVAKKSLAACAREAERVKVALKDEVKSVKTAAVTEADELLQYALGHQVWVKAEYLDEHQADMPRDARRPWVASPASGRPHFEVGDLLLIYAKQTGRCNTIVEVTDTSRLDVAGQVAGGVPDEDAERWPWVTPVATRWQVPNRQGVPLSVLGMTGQSLQPGHRRMPVGGLATALSFMCGADSIEL